MSANNTVTVFKIKSEKINGSNPLYVRRSGEGVDGVIKGIVTENGTPVSRRVMCYHRMSKTLVSTVISDKNGAYIFNNLIAGVKYYVTSLDSNNDAVQYNAVTQDLITASEAIK